MIKEYVNYVKYATEFIRQSVEPSKILFIRLLSPIRNDLDQDFILNTIYSRNFYEFISRNAFLYFYNILIFIKTLLSVIYKMFLSRSHISPIERININPHCKLAFLTHADTIEQIGYHHDAYYGIRKNRSDALFIVLNKTRFSGANLIQLISKFYLSNTILINIPGSIVTISRSYFKGIIIHFYLLFKAITLPCKRFLLACSIDSLSRSSVDNLSIFDQIRVVLEKSSIRTLVITWEGHPWERLLAEYCSNNDISLYGYVHAGPFQYQLSAYRFIGTKFEPQLLLSPTYIAKQLLHKYFNKNSLVIGSNKSSLMLDIQKLAKSQPSMMKHNIKTLLVIPMGTVQDAKRFFKLAINLVDSDLNIRIRLHPALQTNLGLKRYIESKICQIPLQYNLTFSNKTILEDIKLSTHFLYSSSTAAVECLAFGLTPIYYKKDNDLNSLDGYCIPEDFSVETQADIKRVLQYKIDSNYSDSVIEAHREPLNLDVLSTSK